MISWVYLLSITTLIICGDSDNINDDYGVVIDDDDIDCRNGIGCDIATINRRNDDDSGDDSGGGGGGGSSGGGCINNTGGHENNNSSNYTTIHNNNNNNNYLYSAIFGGVFGSAAILGVIGFVGYKYCKKILR